MTIPSLLMFVVWPYLEKKLRSQQGRKRQLVQEIFYINLTLPKQCEKGIHLLKVKSKSNSLNSQLGWKSRNYS